MKKLSLVLLIMVSAIAFIWGNLPIFLLGTAGLFISVFLLIKQTQAWGSDYFQRLEERLEAEDKFFREFEERVEAEDKRLRKLAGELVELYEKNRTNHSVRTIFSEYFQRERISLEDLRQCSEDGLDFVSALGKELLDEVEEALDKEVIAEHIQLQYELEAIT